MSRPKFRMKIDKRWYDIFDWYTTKEEAQATAARHRKDGCHTSVRVIRKLMDRRYPRYYVCVR